MLRLLFFAVGFFGYFLAFGFLVSFCGRLFRRRAFCFIRISPRTNTHLDELQLNFVIRVELKKETLSDLSRKKVKLKQEENAKKKSENYRRQCVYG